MQSDVTHAPSFLTSNLLSTFHNAVAEVYPSSTRRGCFFHHKKSLYKHLRQEYLMEEYLVPDFPVRESFSIIRRRADLATSETSHPFWHGLLLELLQEHLDRDFLSEPQLRTCHVEPVRHFPGADSQIYEHSWRMALRIQRYDVLFQSNPVELHRPSSSGAVSRLCQTYETTSHWATRTQSS